MMRLHNFKAHGTSFVDFLGLQPLSQVVEKREDEDSRWDPLMVESKPFQSPFLTHLENNLKDVGTQLAIWRIMHEAMCRNRRAGFKNKEAPGTYQEVRPN
jgi:hypothetical protein